VCLWVSTPPITVTVAVVVVMLGFAPPFRAVLTDEANRPDGRQVCDGASGPSSYRLEGGGGCLGDRPRGQPGGCGSRGRSVPMGEERAQSSAGGLGYRWVVLWVTSRCAMRNRCPGPSVATTLPAPVGGSAYEASDDMISRDNGMTMASIRPALYERALAVLGEKYGIREELASEALIKCAMAWRMSVRDAAQRIVDRADAKQPPST
jgi:hypothetical protein